MLGSAWEICAILHFCTTLCFLAALSHTEFAVGSFFKWQKQSSHSSSSPNSQKIIKLSVFKFPRRVEKNYNENIVCVVAQKSVKNCKLLNLNSPVELWLYIFLEVYSPWKRLILWFGAPLNFFASEVKRRQLKLTRARFREHTFLDVRTFSGASSLTVHTSEGEASKKDLKIHSTFHGLLALL